MMINIACYSRKSVYSDKSDSTHAQFDICSDYCKQHYSDYDLFRYEDEGYTGANTARPDFSRMVRDIEDGKIQVVVCYKLDRISRDVRDFSNFFGFLQDHHVELVSIKDQIDTSTPLGRAMMYICSVFAQMERETTAERVKDGMAELSRSGKWAGGRAPLGLRRVRVKIDGKSHTVLEDDPETLDAFYFIVDTFLQNDFTLTGMETYFRQNGIKTVNGAFFSTNQIYQILSNPTYCTADQDAYDYFASLGCQIVADRSQFDGTRAIMPYNRTAGGKRKTHSLNPVDKWMISVGLHKPLLTSAQYINIQKRFSHHKIDKTRKYKIGLLKGIVRCRCGHMMRVKHKVDKAYNKVYDHYFCNDRQRRGVEYCDMKFVRVCDIDNGVIDILKRIKLDRSLIDGYIFDDSIHIVHRSRSDVQRDIDRTNGKIHNLTNTLSSASGSSAAKYILQEIEKLDRELSGYKYELMEVSSNEKKHVQAQYDKEVKYRMVCDIVDNIETSDYDEINSLLKELLKECIWDGTTLHIKL